MHVPLARPMTLRSGGQVWVRQIEPGDAAQLRQAFEQLSEQSRYRRFFTGMRTLSDPLVRALTEVDHVDKDALIALPTEDTDAIIGVARFARDPHDPTTADLALTVADEWQGRDLATGLLRLLGRRAAEVGIAHFTVDMLAENRAVLALVRAAGGVQTSSTGTTVTSQIDVQDEADVLACDIAAVLRASARGEILSVPQPVRESIPGVGAVARCRLLPATTVLDFPGSATGGEPTR